MRCIEIDVHTSFDVVNNFSVQILVTEPILNPWFKASMQALPPDFLSPTNKAVYRAVVPHFGTHVATSTVHGAAIELKVQFDTTLVDEKYSKRDLATRINGDFVRGLGICAQPASKPPPPDPKYMFVPVTEFRVGYLGA